MRCTRITTMVRMTDSVSATPTAWTNPLRDPRDLRLPRIAGPCSIVIFGVTGDLSRKKLLPAIYDLANRGLLPPSFGLTGFARRDWTEDHLQGFSSASTCSSIAAPRSANRRGSSSQRASVSCRGRSMTPRRSRG